MGDTDKDKDKGAPGLGGKAFPYEGDELVNGPVAVAMGTDKPSPKGQKENIKLEIPGVHTYIFCWCLTKNVFAEMSSSLTWAWSSSYLHLVVRTDIYYAILLTNNFVDIYWHI